MKRTGGQIVWEALKREGVDVIFGYPGGAILPTYDAMVDYDIHHVLTRHEQGASHMADGYARATGKVGCCIATSGPGATNLITGLATAMLDSSPVVAITGQVGSKAIGTDAGNLSRIENGKQRASPDMAEKLARHFGYAITEIQILYPERFVTSGA